MSLKSILYTLFCSKIVKIKNRFVCDLYSALFHSTLNSIPNGIHLSDKLHILIFRSNKFIDFQESNANTFNLNSNRSLNKKRMIRFSIVIGDRNISGKFQLKMF